MKKFQISHLFLFSILGVVHFNSVARGQTVLPTNTPVLPTLTPVPPTPTTTATSTSTSTTPSTTTGTSTSSQQQQNPVSTTTSQQPTQEQQTKTNISTTTLDIGRAQQTNVGSKPIQGGKDSTSTSTIVIITIASGVGLIALVTGIWAFRKWTLRPRRSFKEKIDPKSVFRARTHESDAMFLRDLSDPYNH